MHRIKIDAMYCTTQGLEPLLLQAMAPLILSSAVAWGDAEVVQGDHDRGYDGHAPEDGHVRDGKMESQAVAAGGEDRDGAGIGLAPTAMLPLSGMSEEEQQVTANENRTRRRLVLTRACSS